MAIEVEQKFPVEDIATLDRQLRGLAAEPGETVTQVDCYYAHPQRDFAVTDEALRLRRVGPMNYITYKGPKLDQSTKTRREIEISLANGQAAATDAAELLEAVGFRPVAEVRKTRRHYTLAGELAITISLDQVDGVGDFVELEIVAEESGVDRARAALAALAEQLDLCNSERRSYLELLLERRQLGRGKPSALEGGP